MSSTQVNPTCPTTNTECPRCLFEPALPVRELSSLSADPRLVLVEIHAGKNPNKSEASVIRPIRKKKAEASRPISWKRALTGWPQENTQGNLVRVYGIRPACCEDRRESPKMALADSTCSAANVSGVARRGTLHRTARTTSSFQRASGSRTPLFRPSCNSASTILKHCP